MSKAKHLDADEAAAALSIAMRRFLRNAQSDGVAFVTSEGSPLLWSQLHFVRGTYDEIPRSKRPPRWSARALVLNFGRRDLLIPVYELLESSDQDVQSVAEPIREELRRLRRKADRRSGPRLIAEDILLTRLAFAHAHLEVATARMADAGRLLTDDVADMRVTRASLDRKRVAARLGVRIDEGARRRLVDRLRGQGAVDSSPTMVRVPSTQSVRQLLRNFHSLYPDLPSTFSASVPSQQSSADAWHEFAASFLEALSDDERHVRRALRLALYARRRFEKGDGFSAVLYTLAQLASDVGADRVAWYLSLSALRVRSSRHRTDLRYPAEVLAFIGSLAKAAGAPLIARDFLVLAKDRATTAASDSESSSVSDERLPSAVRVRRSR